MSIATENTDTGLAIIFPGQGSQSVDMLSELFARYPQVDETFSEASDMLGYDLWQLVSDGPADELAEPLRQPEALCAGLDPNDRRRTGQEQRDRLSHPAWRRSLWRPCPGNDFELSKRQGRSGGTALWPL